ncbi:histidine triad-like protein [Geopyxis carbonaria]|nr:histidine triad-like protein [Geopyxis carbonaria]
MAHSRPPTPDLESLARAHRTPSSHCPFCTISSHFPAPSTPLTPPTPLPALEPPTHIILSEPSVLAFLDIYPLAPCHILVCPRAHTEKVSELTPHANAAVGAWLPVVARAALRVSGYDDFNVVQNNGVSAAQVVPHVHYHVIPRPNERQREELRERTPEEKRYWGSPFGGGWRTELEDDVGARMAEELRAAVWEEVETLRKDTKERAFLERL